MSRLIIAAIVEGHGEQQSAIRTLITRTWTELLGGEYVEVLRPIRRPRASLIRPDELLKAIDLSEGKVSPDPEASGQRKGAVKRWMHGVYSETADQIRLTQAMDLSLCRTRSRSFDKFCRELAQRL